MIRPPFLIPPAIAVLLAVSCAAPSVAATARTLYVSPTGANTNSGTSGRPWRTIEHARDKVREAAADERADVVIIRMGGEYLLDATLVFDMRDGGSNGHSVIHHVMQCHDDGAGIYTLERQNGTVVSENYVHDIGRSPWAGDYVNAGIYFDNGSSFITAERNVVENVFDDKFIKVQDVPKPDTTHDLTLKDNDIHDESTKDAAGPRLSQKNGQSGLEPKALPLRGVVLTKMELPLQVAPGLVLHVAQSGNDDGVGSAEKPFASLERARDEIRAIRKKTGMPKGGVTVLVHGGDYAVSKPFTLTAEDSGIDGALVRYGTAPGEKAAFQGGIRLGGWKPLNDPNLYPLLPRKSVGKVCYVDMKSIGITNPMSFSGYSPAHELFFNDKAMQLARGPNEGFLHIAGVAVTNLDHGPGAYDTRPSSREGVFTYHSDLPDKWAAEPDLLLY